MPKIEPEVIAAKLEFMNRYLDRLEEFSNIALTDYLESPNTQSLVERFLQLIAETGNDANRHILKGLGREQPKQNRDTPIAIAQAGVIDHDLAGRLSQSIGLRNMIVHLYDEIDPTVVHGAISKTLRDYSMYQVQINNYLDLLEKNNDV
ncbi:type VII toxin-antitoxin system HepT family RNase toxin [Pseudanabaena sp. ABRG5-3]|uniref:type VII toxin-antitoxin system HepT family RNase toxin n=1 Tax=Pseudanabaena sp. ABRG5-3 TaxID=685565 RepID=UPI000DC71E21|nr:DUF86 domain-containing protein [Pseudanabaena sp. ABRG5-3]BBC27099.1 hypothetical protein ABRG53_e025 [Pseudanabaena sp. ABRG5-3]